MRTGTCIFLLTLSGLFVAALFAGMPENAGGGEWLAVSVLSVAAIWLTSWTCKRITEIELTKPWQKPEKENRPLRPKRNGCNWYCQDVCNSGFSEDMLTDPTWSVLVCNAWHDTSPLYSIATSNL